jgi:hypothetical protein
MNEDAYLKDLIDVIDNDPEVAEELGLTKFTMLEHPLNAIYPRFKVLHINAAKFLVLHLNRKKQC